jgi:hypothetical protein
MTSAAKPRVDLAVGDHHDAVPQPVGGHSGHFAVDDDLESAPIGAVVHLDVHGLSLGGRVSTGGGGGGQV